MAEKTDSRVERTPDNLAVFLDLEGKVLYWRGAAGEVTVSEAAGRHLHEWVPEDYRPALREAIASAGAQQQAPILFPLNAAGGRLTWWAGRIGPVRRSGQTVELLLVAKNVTREQEARAEQQGRRGLAEALGTVLACLIEAGLQEWAAAVNQALAGLGEAAQAERTFLLRLERAPARVHFVAQWCAQGTVLSKEAWQGESLGEVEGAEALMAESSPVWIGQRGGKHPEGGGGHEGWRALARVHRDGAVWGCLGMDRPQGAQRFSAEDRYLLQASAAGLESALSRWGREEAAQHREQIARFQILSRTAGRLVGDLESLYSTIREQTDFLLARSDHPYLERLGAVDRALRDGTNLCRRLWAAAGSRRLQRRPVALGRLMERVIGVEGPQWVCRIEDDLWSAEIDLAHMEETLHRLCRWATGMGVPGGRWCFSAQNRRLGVGEAGRLGLPPGPYVQGQLGRERAGGPSPSAAEKGGPDPLILDLTAVYQGVRAHGGTLETAPGPLVIFYLPALDPPRSIPVEPPLLQGTDVLLLEPCARLQERAHGVLRALGCQPQVVARCQDVLKALRGHPFGLVILDLDPPDGPVVELFTQVRAICPDARVLLASSSARHPALVPLLRQGCAGWTGKPLRIMELEAAVREAFGLS